MARGASSVAVADDPAWTTLFDARSDGVNVGADRPAVRGYRVSVPSGAAQDVEVSIDELHGETGVAYIPKGSSQDFIGRNITRVRARGVGGTSTVHHTPFIA